MSRRQTTFSQKTDPESLQNRPDSTISSDRYRPKLTKQRIGHSSSRKVGINTSNSRTSVQSKHIDRIRNVRQEHKQASRLPSRNLKILSGRSSTQGSAGRSEVSFARDVQSATLKNSPTRRSVASQLDHENLLSDTDFKGEAFPVEEDSFEEECFPAFNPRKDLSPTENRKAHLVQIEKFITKTLTETRCPKEITGNTYFNDLKKEQEGPWMKLMETIFADPMNTSYRRVLASRHMLRQQERIKRSKHQKSTEQDAEETISTPRAVVGNKRSMKSPSLVNGYLRNTKSREKNQPISPTKMKPMEQLQQSIFNCYGFFNQTLPEKPIQRRATIYQQRKASLGFPNLSTMGRDRRQDNDPFQMTNLVTGSPRRIRKGHTPHFSGCIDNLEKLSLDYLGFDNFMYIMRRIQDTYIKALHEGNHSSSADELFGISKRPKLEAIDIYGDGENHRKTPMEERNGTTDEDSQAEKESEKFNLKEQNQIFDAPLNQYLHSEQGTFHIKTRCRKVWEAADARLKEKKEEERLAAQMSDVARLDTNMNDNMILRLDFTSFNNHQQSVEDKNLKTMSNSHLETGSKPQGAILQRNESSPLNELKVTDFTKQQIESTNKFTDSEKKEHESNLKITPSKEEMQFQKEQQFKKNYLTHPSETDGSQKTKVDQVNTPQDSLDISSVLSPQILTYKINFKKNVYKQELETYRTTIPRLLKNKLQADQKKMKFKLDYCNKESSVRESPALSTIKPKQQEQLDQQATDSRRYHGFTQALLSPVQCKQLFKQAKSSPTMSLSPKPKRRLKSRSKKDTNQQINDIVVKHKKRHHSVNKKVIKPLKVKENLAVGTYKKNSENTFRRDRLSTGATTAGRLGLTTPSDGNGRNQTVVNSGMSLRTTTIDNDFGSSRNGPHEIDQIFKKARAKLTSGGQQETGFNSLLTIEEQNSKRLRSFKPSFPTLFPQLASDDKLIDSSNLNEQSIKEMVATNKTTKSKRNEPLSPTLRQFSPKNLMMNYKQEDDDTEDSIFTRGDGLATLDTTPTPCKLLEMSSTSRFKSQKASQFKRQKGYKLTQNQMKQLEASSTFSPRQKALLFSQQPSARGMRF